MPTRTTRGSPVRATYSCSAVYTRFSGTFDTRGLSMMVARGRIGGVEGEVKRDRGAIATPERLLVRVPGPRRHSGSRSRYAHAWPPTVAALASSAPPPRLKALGGLPGGRDAPSREHRPALPRRTTPDHLPRTTVECRSRRCGRRGLGLPP